MESVATATAAKGPDVKVADAWNPFRERRQTNSVAVNGEAVIDATDRDGKALAARPIKAIGAERSLAG